MGRAADSVHVALPPAEVWAFYFDPGRWPTWVDGFQRVEASDGYPETGGTLRWCSTTAGRGTVTERVLEHRPHSLHRIAFSDPESDGELATTFEPETYTDGAEGTRVSQESTYRLRGAGPLTRLTDPIFIRPQVARSLGRSLERLRTEAEELASR